MERWLETSVRWRLLFAGLALLLVAPFLLPLWQTRMEAPQYKDDEALEVAVYAGRVIGDLKEIHTLNQYVGVQLPLNGAEMRLVPFAFATLVVIALIASLAPPRWHRPLAKLLLLLLVAVVVCGLAVLQFRLYELGHDRGEQIFEGVKDFTPPVLGHIKVANFDARMSLGAGGWMLALAIVLCATMVFDRRLPGHWLVAPGPKGEPA